MKRFIIHITIILAITPCIGQTLIAGWDFQTTSNGGTAVDVAPYTPSVFVANFGIGTLYLDGSNGSSDWIKTTPDNEVTALSGCYLNAGPEYSTVTAGYASLVFLGGTNCSSNGKYAVFKFPMTGKSNLVVSYAAKRNSTGFTSQTWEYSCNGEEWTHLQTLTNICTETFDTLTLNVVNELDNTETGYLRMSPTCASSTGGYNKIDNIQFNADVSISTGSELISAMPDMRISISNGVLRFNASAREKLEIYNAFGQKLIEKPTIKGLNEVPLSVKGLIIIKTGNCISKMIM